jgi:hypothetical protein
VVRPTSSGYSYQTEANNGVGAVWISDRKSKGHISKILAVPLRP